MSVSTFRSGFFLVFFVLVLFGSLGTPADAVNSADGLTQNPAFTSQYVEISTSNSSANLYRDATSNSDADALKIAVAPGLPTGQRYGSNEGAGTLSPSPKPPLVIKVQNYPTNGSVMLRVENPTSQALHVFFVPEAGGERPYVAPVNAGKFVDVPTDQGQVFAFSDGQQWVGGLYTVAEAARQTVTLPLVETGNAAPANAGQGNGTAIIRVENTSGQALQIHALSPDGASAPMVGQVAANSFTEISGTPGQVIGVSDGQNWIGGQYTVITDANQTVRFPLDSNAAQAANSGTAGSATASEGANTPAGNTSDAGTIILRLRNPTDQEYQVHVISPDRSQAPLAGIAKAQFANDLPFLPGQLLGFSDGNNWIGD